MSTEVELPALPAQRAAWKGILGQLRRAPIFPTLIIGILVAMAIFAPLIAPHSPEETSLPNRLKPPAWVKGGSTNYLLGTDQVGRDILSRIIYGSRVSMEVAVVSLFFGGLIGTAVGLASGYLGGKVDAILMRTADATMAFPIILFALLLVVTLGASLLNVVLAIALVLWARYARVIRGEVLSLREREYVALAKIAGASPFRIMVRHLFPNVINTLMVLLSLQVGWVIIVEASLSFLGAGVPPPAPAWGQMVSSGRDFVSTAWWVSFFPGLAIVFTVLAFNLLGDWLRDAFDPRLRQL